MSYRPAPAGTRVSVGHIRVDAKRAIEKLRKYQLAEPTTWILEAIRAAVCSGAETIELSGDSNDVWLAWRGPVWPMDVVSQLLSELVSPEGQDSQHFRLLATAINSVLGQDPSFVDVYCVEGGSAQRAHFTPNLFLVSEHKESTLAAPVEQAQAPVGVGEEGMVVHLRRRLGMKVLGHLWKGGPPELALARETCKEVAVPVSVAGERVSGEKAGELLRVPADAGLDGFAAIMTRDAESGEASEMELLLAEHGVVLQRRLVKLDGTDSAAPHPVRLFLNAERMPTNASRSRVREDSFPADAFLRKAEDLVMRLCHELCQRVEARDDDYENMRRGALSWLATVVSGRWWNTTHSGGVYGRLSKLTLLRNAVGDSRSLADTLWGSVVHQGKAPYPSELGPWLGEVLWLPKGDPARWLAGPLPDDNQSVRRMARQARKTLRAQRRFFDHEKREPVLGHQRSTWVSSAIGARVAGTCKPAPSALVGEVCLRSRGRGGQVVLLHQGRELEEVDVVCPVSFRAIVNSDQLTPSNGYRGAERNHVFDHVIWGIKLQVIRCAEALVMMGHGELPGGFELGDSRIPDRDDMDDLVFGVLALVTEDGGQLGDSPLAQDPVWTSATGGRKSTAELRQERAVGVITGSRKWLPQGRTVLRVHRAHEWLLRYLLEPSVKVVSYDLVGLVEPAGPVELLRLNLESFHREAAILHVGQDPLDGAIAWTGNDSRLLIGHAGELLEKRPYQHLLVRCQIYADADMAIPTRGLTAATGGESWAIDIEGALWALPSEDEVDLHEVAIEKVVAWEAEMARAVARELCGMESGLSAPETLSPLHGAGRDLFSALAKRRRKLDILLGPEMWQTLQDRPLFPVRGSPELLSLSQLWAVEQGRLPYVETPASGEEELGTWTPLLAAGGLAEDLARIAGIDAYDASNRLRERADAALRDRNWAAHLARDVDPELGGAFAREASVSFEFQGGRARVRLADTDVSSVTVVVRIADREFARRTVARDQSLFVLVDADESAATRTFGELRSNYVMEVIAEFEDKHMAELLVAVVRGGNVPLLDIPQAVKLLIDCSREHQFSPDLSGESAAWMEELRSIPCFRSLQGKACSLADASDEHLRWAVWSGEWLEGSAPNELDRPILSVPLNSSEVVEYLALVAAKLSAVNLGDEVVALQLQRQVETGIIAVPKLSSVSADAVMSLRDAGAATLGVGEIGLCAGEPSLLHLYRGGQFERTVKLEVAPPVHVALESASVLGELEENSGSIARLSKQLAKAARALLANVIREEGEDLPEWIREIVVRYTLAGLLKPGDAPLFTTTTGKAGAVE